MPAQLKLADSPWCSLSPFVEIGAYEALWDQDRTSFKVLADRFRDNPGALPSHFVDEVVARDYAARAVTILRQAGIAHFGVRIHGAGEYPPGLRDAEHPVELLYYQGIWNLVETPSVAIVGARKATDDGIARAKKLARLLVRDGYTVVSGLASGIDTAAHTTALEEGGRTIGVLGTPLSQSYPAANRDLQRTIADQFLVISQVPVIRHARQHPGVNRFFFPERNVTMSALTLATIIVEASDTSGTLTQARAALHQGRKLFILDSCFRVPGLTWPARFAERGAVRVTDYAEISEHLGPTPHSD